MTRQALLAATLAGSFALSGCTAMAGANAAASLIDSLATAGNGPMTLEKVAVKACGKQAIKYGTVSITDMTRRTPDTVFMAGHIQAETGYKRLFTCFFRTDGQVQFNVT